VLRCDIFAEMLPATTISKPLRAFPPEQSIYVGVTAEGNEAWLLQIRRGCLLQHNCENRLLSSTLPIT
jgi:hypothetical protein